MNGRRRPNASDKGAQRSGPAAKPRTYKLMLRVINSVETPKRRVVAGTAAAKIELEKETVKVVKQIAMTANVLRVNDQFIGFEGS
jgi:hypothetical protein